MKSAGDRWLTGNEYQWWCKSVKQKQSPAADNRFGAGERRIGCGQKAITQSSDGGVLTVKSTPVNEGIDVLGSGEGETRTPATTDRVIFKQIIHREGELA